MAKKDKISLKLRKLNQASQVMKIMGTTKKQVMKKPRWLKMVK